LKSVKLSENAGRGKLIFAFAFTARFAEIGK